MEYWKMNVTDLESDNDIKFTAQCIKSRYGTLLPCGDRNNFPVLREVSLYLLERN